MRTVAMNRSLWCHRCKAETVSALMRRVFCNGVTHFFWQCAKCKHSAEGPGKWIPKDVLRLRLMEFRATEEDVPIWKSVPTVECSVAGR